MLISSAVIISAFVMGLAGSLHCIGMCGPLALSLPVQHSSVISRISGGLVYNTGRVLSYSLLGVVFGSLGNLVVASKWQNGLSIALGIIILAYLFIPKKYFHFSSNNYFAKPFLWLRKQLGRLFQSAKLSSIFFIGILNGFLPCGLVYLALTSSAITASAAGGGLFMLSFGAGTFPLMFATVLMGNYLNQSLRQKINKAVPALLFVMATLLILRGLNLGIPFISPEIGDHTHETVSCH
jgi:sulfite exporter TauE/SafE